MSEGKLRIERLVDKSLKHQASYAKGFYKEVSQEAAFKRKNWGYDSKNKLSKCMNNTMKRLHQEGLVKDVKGFMKDALKVKGL